jgi:hypothetical protein
MEVVAVVAGCSVLDGVRLGSSMKVRRPRIAAREWEGAEAAVAPKVCMTAVGGKHARVLKVGKIGYGMVVARP